VVNFKVVVLVAAISAAAHSFAAAESMGEAQRSTKYDCDIRMLVTRLAPTYGLDPALVNAVIAAESAFDADAVSAKNAKGLMQLMPDTAKRFGVADAFDPEQNLRGGMSYLRFLLDLFNGEASLALAAYNAGEGAVLRYRGIPPYSETRDYVVKVLGYRTGRSPALARQAGAARRSRLPIIERRGPHFDAPPRVERSGGGVLIIRGVTGLNAFARHGGGHGI
jgi:soluble lytic murein transglycosylase-like protein